MEAAMMEQYKDLQKIRFDEITEATNTFHEDNYLGGGAFGNVYKGKLSRFKERGAVAFKRLDRQFGQGEPEFLIEISTLSKYKHKNLIILLGYCMEGKELILVYEYASNGSLESRLNSPHLTWTLRLNICLQAAEGLRYLHDPNGAHQMVIHRDIKSGNILLDDKWNAKISDAGLSKIIPENTKVHTLVKGTPGYTDPEYHETFTLTEHSDVYSFGVTLFEVLCGSLCYEIRGVNQVLVFVHKWKESYKENKLKEIIFKGLRSEQMDQSSLKLFSDIAYQCLEKSGVKRPPMVEVVSKLKAALQAQERYDLNLRIPLPEEYAEIVQAAVFHPTYSSVEQLKDLLSEGILIDEGKAWFALNMNGKRSQIISIAECLDSGESKSAFSSEFTSRFSSGSYIPPHETFMTTCAKPRLLSPNTTYIMNLVFKKMKPSDLYIGLEYKFKGTTYYSFLSDKKEDGWSTAELFHLSTNQIATVDKLEIMFKIKYCDINAVEGIEFQPLEVEHGVFVGNQVDRHVLEKNWKEILETAVDENGKEYIKLPTRVALKNDGRTWKYLPKTSFKEIIQDPLSKFRITCIIESKKLSADTIYAAYLVYKQKVLEFQPAPALVKDTKTSNEALPTYLQTPQTPVIISGKVCRYTDTHRPNLKCIPQLRDGWMEVQIWEFKTNGNTTMIPMDIELSSYDKRSFKGLEAGGIEFRPIDKN